MIHRMEVRVMRILIVFAIGMDYWSCSGLRVNEHDPSIVKEVLKASVEKVNSQSLSPFLYRAFHSSVKRVHGVDKENMVMNLEFSIRETSCKRNSRDDASTCAFQRGLCVVTANCRSTVQVTARQVQNVRVHCFWSSGFDSDSSEEMSFGEAMKSDNQRNNYILGSTPEKPKVEPPQNRSIEPTRTNILYGNRRYRYYRRTTKTNGR